MLQWIQSKAVGIAVHARPLGTDTLPAPAPGAVCDFRLSYGRVLSRRSKIIVVNRNREEMLLNSDIFWKPQEAVQGELRSGPTAYWSLSSWPVLSAALSWVSE